MFMAFQYPVAIPGVTVSKYLRMIMNASARPTASRSWKIKEFAKTAQEMMGSRPTSRVDTLK